MGKRFRGVYNRYTVSFTSSAPVARPTDGILITDLTDPRLHEMLGSQAKELREDVALLEGAANPLELAHYRQGSQTPVFFGSAINNFGVRELLEAFVEMAPSPRARPPPPYLSIPKRMLFRGLHLNSGQHGPRPPRPDRLCPHLLRQVHARHEGDAPPSRQGGHLGQRHHLHGAGPRPCGGSLSRGYHRHPQSRDHQIGDTFSEKEPLQFHRHPQLRAGTFPPVRLKNPLKLKQLQKGLIQLAEEGAVQFFRPVAGSAFILGAVGVLQFDVTMARLKNEYGVDAVYEPVTFAAARWVTNKEQNWRLLKRRRLRAWPMTPRVN